MSKMKIKMKYDISTLDAPQESGQIDTEVEEPVMINMELCIEKSQYLALKKNCVEYKTTIVQAILDLLNGDPEELTEQYF